MSGLCATSGDHGVVRNMLTAVDCNTRHFAQLGYHSLTSDGSSFQTVMTILLTIYVALIGYRLLFAPDGARVSEGAISALKIGAVIALVTNWSLFQTLVFDTASQAPVEIAALISAPLQANSPLAASPVEGLQTAYDALSASAETFGSPKPQTESPTALNQAIQQTAQTSTGNHSDTAAALRISAVVLFLGCAGMIAVATITVGLLTAIGPVFIALFLFLETRGLFIGWVRALIASSFAILSTWTLTVLLLQVIEPWLLQLAQQLQIGVLDDQMAMTAVSIVFVFAACQLGLVLTGFVIARGFSFGGAARAPRTGTATAIPVAPAPLPFELVSRAGRLSEQLQTFESAGAFADRRISSTMEAAATGRTSFSAATVFGAAGRATFQRRSVVVGRGNHNRERPTI